MLKVSAALAIALVSLCAAPRLAHAAPCALDDAAMRTRAAAFDTRDATSALAASMTYLEAVNQRGQKEPACFDRIDADAPRLRELYCLATSPSRDTDACVMLDKIQMDLLRLAAQKKIEAADKATGEAAKPLFVEAGQAYLDAYRAYCEQPVLEGRPRHVEPRVCEETGYNAARAFGAAHLPAKALGTYRLLVAEDERSGRGSPLAARAFYDIGNAYRAMGLYEEAAEWLERFATREPKHERASVALTDAAVLRLGLGQDAQAAADIASFARNWGLTRRAEAAQLSLMLAAHHAEHGDDERARGVLGAAMPMLDRGPADLVVRAHALAAKVASSRAVAKVEWAKVRAAWSDPAAAERAMRRGWPTDDEAQSDRRLARALSAVGEAMLVAADELRVAEVDSVKLAPLAGAADAAAITTYGNTTLRAFLVKKREAIERVEAAYRNVLEIKPVPPPLAVVAASAAVGAMWGDFADELRRVPIPMSVRKDRAAERAYIAAVDEGSEPIRNGRARPAMKACLAYAAKYQVVDLRTRQCETWLVKHGADFHPVEELVPALRVPAMAGVASPLLAGSPAPDP
jgi:tetratricopeptide (TPR) repeat protein